MGILEAHFPANIGTPMPIFTWIWASQCQYLRWIWASRRENKHIVMPILTVNIGHRAVSGTKLDILMPKNTNNNTDRAVNWLFTNRAAQCWGTGTRKRQRISWLDQKRQVTIIVV